jgi:catechol 2,3-dioxygenase-like lactoylglutathione lyase family enzyme
MAITGMNHFNVLTDDVAATRRFYIDIVGLVEGERPPLGFDGAWLYAGGRPILHVSAAKLPSDRAGVIDHMAFSASDLAGTLARLEAHGVKFALRQQVGTRIWQIFCHDPMGAKVELDFDPAEKAPAGYGKAAS